MQRQGSSPPLNEAKASYHKIKAANTNHHQIHLFGPPQTCREQVAIMKIHLSWSAELGHLGMVPSAIFVYVELQRRRHVPTHEHTCIHTWPTRSKPWAPNRCQCGCFDCPGILSSTFWATQLPCAWCRMPLWQRAGPHALQSQVPMRRGGAQPPVGQRDPSWLGVK